MSVRFKRVAAFAVDWLILGIPSMVFSLIWQFHLKDDPSLNTMVAFIMFPIVLITFALVVFRDVLLKGRSAGKRIFGLYIYDKNTLQPASSKKKIVKNLFFQVLYIDGIVLLATGRTIGERVTNTVVLPKKSVDE